MRRERVLTNRKSREWGGWRVDIDNLTNHTSEGRRETSCTKINRMAEEEKQVNRMDKEYPRTGAKGRCV